ncbi:hypothetical protein Sste5344_008305 [Sporothrix stenoceras]
MPRGSGSPPPAGSPASSTHSSRTQNGSTVRKSERSHEENQERAFIAASRRADRSLEARIQSARMASNIHKQRTGRGFKISEEIVLKEDMYEEEDDDLPRLQRNQNRGYSLDLNNIPAGVSVSEYHARMLHEAEINDLFARTFGSLSGPSPVMPQGQVPLQQLQQTQPQMQQPQHAPVLARQDSSMSQQSQGTAEQYAIQFRLQQQQHQQYHNQQQQPPYPNPTQPQQPGQLYQAQQQQPFLVQQQQQQRVNVNDPAYFQHRTSIASVAVSNDGSGSFTMVGASPHAAHAGLVGPASRTNSVATGADMLPGLSNASSSNDTGSNTGSHRMPMAIDMSTVAGGYTIPATAHDGFRPSLGVLPSHILSPQAPGLDYASTPNTTPSVSTSASQDGSIAAVSTHSAMPHIRRESSGNVLTSFGAVATMSMSPTSATVKPIDTAAWAEDAGTAATMYPVLDPNVPQLVNGSVLNGSALSDSTAMTMPMAWSTYPQDGSIPATAGPATDVPFSQPMAMDSSMSAPVDFMTTDQPRPGSTAAFPSQVPMHALPPNMTADAMKEQLSSRIGTPGGGEGDHWNEWISFQNTAE